MGVGEAISGQLGIWSLCDGPIAPPVGIYLNEMSYFVLVLCSHDTLLNDLSSAQLAIEMGQLC